MNIQIIELDGPAIEGRLGALSQILADSVAEGAAISFMAPLSYDDAARFWSRDVQPEVTSGRRVLFGAAGDDNLLGTVQLITAMPPNQPHRCEIAKMILVFAGLNATIYDHVDPCWIPDHSPRCARRGQPLFSAAC